MDPIKNPITPEFIEAMVDRIIDSLTAKLEELDISMDYIAAALLNTDPLGLGSTQSARGRAGAGTMMGSVRQQAREREHAARQDDKSS
jgi:hypothetical protein